MARRILLPVALVLAGLAIGCEITFDEKREPRVGRWTPDAGWAVQAPGQPSPTAQALRADARAAFDAARWEDALVGLLEIEQAYPESTEARDAYTSFLIAECYFNLNDYETAHEYYQKTLYRRPVKAILDPTLQRIYNIGLLYLHGIAKRTFVGVHYTSPSFGVEILFGENGLVDRYPYLDYSDNALWEVAKYYYEAKEYPEAERVLEQLVQDHVDSEWNEAAEFLLAESVFKQVKGEDYDQGPIQKAKRKFDVYRHHYPRGSKIAEAREYLARIAEMEARHDLKVAKYYLRESRPKAAIYYLRSVILNYPKTTAYREASEIYHDMAPFRDDVDDVELEGAGS